MKFLIKLLVTALAVMLAAYVLPGVEIVDTKTAIIVAVVLALLNTFVKPILIILTIPITLVTLGLFLLVINIIIIKIADGLIDGFTVDSWFWALLFSLVVSLIASLLDGFAKRSDDRRGIERG